MNELIAMPPESPSLIASFGRGALSSAFSGALMSGIVSLVTPLLSGAATVTFLGTLGYTAPLLILSTGLFGGVMAVKNVMFAHPHEGLRNEPTVVPVPVQSVGSPTISADIAENIEQPSKSWVTDTGRAEGAQSSIQQILANGSLSDKDRARVILAAREATASSDTGRSA
jgi:hypothetical protein